MSLARSNPPLQKRGTIAKFPQGRTLMDMWETQAGALPGCKSTRLQATATPWYARIPLSVSHWFHPSVRELDQRFVREVGACRNFDELLWLAEDFRRHRLNRTFVRRTLRIRPSGRRVCRLARRLSG